MASFVQKGLATLIIANFKEYVGCLRNLFAGEQAEVLDKYAQDMAKSGKKQKETKEKLQKEIAALTAKINFWRQRIKKEENKAALSQELSLFKITKQELLRKLKQKSQTSRFAMLSDESKAILCCLTVLRKYLTKELMNNKFVGMKTNEDGNLVFSREVFENSFLYNDARHIYDYMLAYIIENPEQVLTETHFNKFFDKESGWRGIVHVADKFFEKKNKRKKSRAEIIAESRSDLELIREYPQQKVVLVRLVTPEALDYEGTAAHNCVGAGSYDKLLNQVNSGIFSLRRETKDGELKPVATIEFKNGLITQFRGICNGIVAYDYNLAARDVTLRMMRAESVAELVNNEKLNDVVLNSLGIYRDGKGGFLDIHNLSGDEGFVLPKLVVDGDSLGKYEFEKLKIEQLQIEGLRPEDAKYLSKFKWVKNLTINQIEDGVVLDFSDFDYLTDLTTELKNGSGKIVNLPKSVTRITYRGKNILQASGEVERIYIQCSGNNKVSLEDIPSAKDIVVNSMGNIDLSGDAIYPRLESLSLDGDLLSDLCAEKFPNLMMLSCSNIKSLGHIPSLKMIDITGTSDTLIDLSNNPQLLVAKIKGKGVRLRLADCHPNLKDFYTENVGLDLFDVKSFPQLENLKLGVSDSCI
ncbi:MAG: PcfJ domain-containing protein, partial [Alphaproteobacteria bacterium]|nr:PcfJ domain-containing protein [Alphaproteobacteria bacterium]